MSVPLPTLVIGAGGHARVLISLMRLAGELAPVGILDDDETRWGEEYDGVTILGSTSLLSEHPRAAEACAIGIGRNSVRARFFELARQYGYRLPPLIHPSAVVAADVSLPAGIQLLANSVVNPGTTLGENVILNTGAQADHDNRIASHVHLHPAAILAGGVRIGEFTYIGTNAAVNPYLSIGARSMIGSGSMVIKDIPDGVMAFGVPARVIRPWDGV